MTHSDFNKGISLLIVDDDVDIRKSASRYLRTQGFEVDVAASHDAAEAFLRTDPPQIFILDISRGPGPSGIQLLSRAKGIAPQVLFIAYSGYAAGQSLFEI